MVKNTAAVLLSGLLLGLGMTPNLAAQIKKPGKLHNSGAQNTPSQPSKRPSAKNGTKPMDAPEADIVLNLCQGNDARASQTIKFTAFDKDYQVFLTDATIFTRCDHGGITPHASKIDVKKGSPVTCTVDPNANATIKYFVRPIGGMKECGCSSPNAEGSRILVGGDPNDITVP